jgi:hypothetical protein
MRRSPLGWFVFLACIWLLVLPPSLLTQDSNTTSSVRVGIMLDSSKARIQNLLPQLRERAKKIATDKKKNIVAVILLAGTEPALHVAKAANCD